MAELITEINKLIKTERLNRKQIYEYLLSKGTIKPNSEKIVFETLQYGLDNNLIPSNRIIRYRKKRGKLPQIFSVENLIKIFDTNNNFKLGIIIWLGFFCGLRIREVCQLQTCDIDLNNKRIFIRDSKNPNRTRDNYGKDGFVPIPDIAIGPLKKWLEILNGGKWLLPSMTSENDHIKPKTVHEQYRNLLNQCNLSEPDQRTPYETCIYGRRKELIKNTYRYRFHTLRHSYATYLLDRGVPLENISRLLRHSQIDTTLIYARVSDKKSQNFVNSAFELPMKLVNPEPTRQINTSDPFTTLKQRLANGDIDLMTYKHLLSEISQV